MANNENKLKSFKWSKNTTVLLISLISQNYKQLQCGVKKITFQQIALVINEQLGTNLAYDQVESKWKGLKKTYLKMKDSKTKLSWELYDQIDEILKDDTEIYSSVNGCETKFDFVDYTIEPESSTFRQTRKRRRHNSDEHHSENEKYTSAEDVTGGTEDDRNDTDCRDCKRNHNCYESIEDARERRHQEKMKMARKFLAIFERMVERM